MSQQTEDCERKIIGMLGGDKEAESVCRFTLEGIATNESTPTVAIAAALRAAIRVRMQHEGN